MVAQGWTGSRIESGIIIVEEETVRSDSGVNYFNRGIITSTCMCITTLRNKILSVSKRENQLT